MQGGAVAQEETVNIYSARNAYRGAGQGNFARVKQSVDLTAETM